MGGGDKPGYAERCLDDQHREQQLPRTRFDLSADDAGVEEVIELVNATRKPIGSAMPIRGPRTFSVAVRPKMHSFSQGTRSLR